MGLDTLYSDDIEAGIQRQIAKPPPFVAPSFSVRSFLSAGMKGLHAGAADIAGGITDASAALGFDKSYASLDNTPEANAASLAMRNGTPMDLSVGDELRSNVAANAPDAATASTADQVLYGLSRTGSKVVAALSVANGPVAAGLLFGEGTNSAYRDLIGKGIDPTTALKVAGVEGAGQAAAVIPMAGSTLLRTALLGAVAGPGSFMAQEELSKKILEQAGYNDEASRHDPLDPLGLTVATALPALVGGLHMRNLGKIEQVRAAKQGDMPAAVMLTPQEQAHSDAYERSAANLQELQTAIKNQPDPALKAVLQEEFDKQTAAATSALHDDTATHAAQDPDAVDAARVRVTQDALYRDMPKDVDAPAEVERAGDSIAAGEVPDVRPLREDLSALTEERDTLAAARSPDSEPQPLETAIDAAVNPTAAPADVESALTWARANDRPDIANAIAQREPADVAPRNQGTNALPKQDSVTLEPAVAQPKATKAAVGPAVDTATAARVKQLAEESPDMAVHLPGADKPTTVAEALKSATDQHALDSSDSDLMQAALDCALGFGA